MTDAILQHIDQKLENGDEEGAVQCLRSADIRRCSAQQLHQLFMRARQIDRNDLALPLLAAMGNSTANQVAALQLRMEMGEAVANEMAALLSGGDANDPAVMPLVAALEQEARVGEAIEQLTAALVRSPDWLAGYQQLVQLRWTAGIADAAAPMRDALADQPGHELLHAAYIGTLKSMEDYGALAQQLADFTQAFPTSPLIHMVAAEALSEMGQISDAERLFSDLASVEDPAFDAARMRHLMRAGRPDMAARVGARAVTTHGLPECWAWMGAALRCLDDPRAQWFYRGTDLLSTRQVAFDEAQRLELAEVLRSLHVASAPPFGQSPRGGTQTLGHLLKRREPILVALRAALLAAVRQHVADLPPIEDQHPILGKRRSPLQIEGAWSILLRGGGRHVSHIHSHGWISSAIYIDLPAGMDESSDEKGWLQIGVPPITGGAAIEPLLKVRPAPMQLALFPSLFWHGTMPFDEGERLTVAFDIISR